MLGVHKFPFLEFSPYHRNSRANAARAKQSVHLKTSRRQTRPQNR